MFGFFKPRAKSVNQDQLDYYKHKAEALARQLRGAVCVDRHAMSHLCDFIQAVANNPPSTVSRQGAADLVSIAAAVSQLTQQGGVAPTSARLAVFSRYPDYIGKPPTYEHLFELAEWIISGSAEQ